MPMIVEISLANGNSTVGHLKCINWLPPSVLLCSANNNDWLCNLRGESSSQFLLCYFPLSSVLAPLALILTLLAVVRLCVTLGHVVKELTLIMDDFPYMWPWFLIVSILLLSLILLEVVHVRVLLVEEMLHLFNFLVILMRADLSLSLIYVIFE